MSQRSHAWKRRLIAMAMGGSVFNFFGFWGNGCVNGASNPVDPFNFYNTVGRASIAAFSDGVLNDNVANSDYDNIVRAPVTTYFQDLWSNWSIEQFPNP